MLMGALCWGKCVVLVVRKCVLLVCLVCCVAEEEVRMLRRMELCVIRSAVFRRGKCAELLVRKCVLLVSVVLQKGR